MRTVEVYFSGVNSTKFLNKVGTQTIVPIEPIFGGPN